MLLPLWRLLPLLTLGYGICFIDRSNVSFAELQLKDDLESSRDTIESKNHTSSRYIRFN